MPDQQAQDPGYRARAEAERDLAAARAQAEADLQDAKNPPKYQQTGDTYFDTASNFIKDLVKGTGKGAFRLANELGRYTMNPGLPPAGLPGGMMTPFDAAIEQTKPEGTVQNIASYIPDLALAGAEGFATRGLTGAARRWAGTSWADALKRPLAERVGGRDKLAEEILGQGFGRLTRPNASRAAEYAASKAPPGEREAAFKLMDKSYQEAKVPTDAGVAARIFAPAGQAFRAQATTKLAPAIPYGVSATQLAADALARMMSQR